MWLVTTLIVAIGVTALGFIAPKKYKFGYLSMMLWGASIMILVDHILGYVGGEFLELETNGLITNGILLGIVMLIPIFIIWESLVLIPKIKAELSRR